MECPYCDLSASRMRLHSHVVEEHGGVLERDGTTYTLSCPSEGCAETLTMGAGTSTEDALEGFGNEVRMLAFDRLLDHLEEEHGKEN